MSHRPFTFLEKFTTLTKMKVKEIIQDARTRSNKNAKILLVRVKGGGGLRLKSDLCLSQILL